MKNDKSQLGLDKFSVLLKFDSRVSVHNVRFGIMSEAEIKAHITSLPDSGSNLDHVRIEDPNANGVAQ